MRVMRSKIFIALVLLSLVALTAVLAPRARELLREFAFAKTMRESTSYRERGAAYASLIRTQGVMRAQEVLSASFNDSGVHMVNHLTGAALYKEFGLDGLAKCKPYLTYSCHHGFIAAVVVDRGLDDIASLARVCERDTTREAEVHCKHGIGHGFLESVGFEKLPLALSLCARVFVEDANALEQCYWGVFMESALRDIPIEENAWMKSDDPMYPCNEPEVVHLHAHRACWHYVQSRILLSANLYPSIGGDIAKATIYCKGLSDSTDRGACFSGVAWYMNEQYGTTPEAGLSKCNELPDQDSARCREQFAQHAYYFENRSLSILRACADSEREEECLRNSIFFGIVRAYDTADERVAACKRDVRAAFRAACSAFVVSKATYPRIVSPVADLDMGESASVKASPVDLSQTLYRDFLGPR